MKFSAINATIGEISSIPIGGMILLKGANTKSDIAFDVAKGSLYQLT